MNLRRHLAWSAILLLGAASCGYRVIDPTVGRGRALHIPPSANDTRWRGIELSLTSALRSDAQRLLDVRLGEQPPDLVLKTEIVEVIRQVPVGARSGAAALGASSLRIRWSLENAAGLPMGEGNLHRTLEFLPSEDESSYTALGEILDSMAEQVVMDVSARLAGAENHAPETE